MGEPAPPATRVFSVESDDRDKFNRVLDLLRDLGLESCPICRVWKSPARFPVMAYSRDGSEHRNPICGACVDHPADGSGS